MKPLKVKVSNDLGILKIVYKPNLVNKEFLGCGINFFVKSVSDPNESKSEQFLFPIQEDSVCHESDFSQKPSALVEEEGRREFGFRTPSKSGGMLAKVESAIRGASPGTPKRTRIPISPLASGSPRTPQRKTPRASKSLYRTPTSKDQSRRRSWRGGGAAGSPPVTPRAVRARVKKGLQRCLEEEDSADDLDDSDQDTSYLPSDGESSDNEMDTDVNENETPSKKSRLLPSSFQGTPLRTPRRGRKHRVNVDMVASTDAYFAHLSDTGLSLTSDHTLKQLEKPRLGPEALKSLLSRTASDHLEERRELFEDHLTLFPHWITLLCEGFNLFLCGVGSKKGLLSVFQQHLAEADHLIVNGFFPSLTIKTVLLSILEEIMEVRSHPVGVPDQLQLITTHYRNPNVDPLFLIVHNLDGPMLRNETAQSAFSQLASCNGIHLVASLDHVNSALLFDASKYSAYNALWWDATTLAPYTEETCYENSLMVQQSGSLVLSSLVHVFKSLTPNAKGIFMVLANHQVQEHSNANYTGLAFADLYQKCRENFLVNSDLTLRAQLTEFKDHKLIKIKRGVDGSENLFIPLDAPSLQDFIEQQDQ